MTMGRANRTLRQPLTGKKANKNFYKGSGRSHLLGGAPLGKMTRAGGFRVQEHKVPQFVVPDLEGFHLKPYVSRRLDREVLDNVQQKVKRGPKWVARKWEY